MKANVTCSGRFRLMLASFRDAIKKKQKTEEVRDSGAEIFWEGLRASKPGKSATDVLSLELLFEPADSKHTRSCP